MQLWLIPILPLAGFLINGILGRRFSKVYYVEQATHHIDGNGYRTRFKVKETTL